MLNTLHGLLGFPIVRLVSGETVPFSSGLVMLLLPEESPSPWDLPETSEVGCGGSGGDLKRVRCIRKDRVFFQFGFPRLVFMVVGVHGRIDRDVWWVVFVSEVMNTVPWEVEPTSKR